MKQPHSGRLLALGRRIWLWLVGMVARLCVADDKMQALYSRSYVFVTPTWERSHKQAIEPGRKAVTR